MYVENRSPENRGVIVTLAMWTPLERARTPAHFGETVSGSRKAIRYFRRKGGGMTTFVISKDGERLMPTTNIRKIRKLLRSGRAVIASHHPFTVQLMYETTNGTQPVELSVDTGYENIGISVKSEKREYASAEYKLLTNEKQRHDDQRREHRRPRRNRKRYRKARFGNRRKPEGWLAPSVKNKKEIKQ